MEQILINAETASTKEAFVNFLQNYKVQVAQYLNALIGNDGSPVDSSLVFNADGTITVYQLAPDKGFVLGAVDGEIPLQVMKYASLTEGQKYVIQEHDRQVLFVKEPKGSPDFKVGVFKTLSDAVTELNSDAVNKEVQNAKDRKAALAKTAERTENRLRRLGKTTETAEVENVTEAEAVDMKSE